jgi:hypothetical protein
MLYALFMFAIRIQNVSVDKEFIVQRNFFMKSIQCDVIKSADSISESK